MLGACANLCYGLFRHCSATGFLKINVHYIYFNFIFRAQNHLRQNEGKSPVVQWNGAWPEHLHLVVSCSFVCLLSLKLVLRLQLVNSGEASVVNVRNRVLAYYFYFVIPKLGRCRCVNKIVAYP